MYLRPHLESYFPVAVRNEGQHFARMGRVLMIEGTRSLVESEVADGDGVFDVKLTRSGAVVSAECSCGETQCGHMWGTILQAEMEGSFKGPLGGGHPFMMVQRLGSLSAGSNDSRWKDIIARAATNSKGPVDPPAHKRVDLEIYYEISAEASTWRSGLGVGLRCRERRASGQWGTIKQLHMARTEINSLNLSDRQIIERLTGSRMLMEYDRDYLPTEFLLNGPSAAELLETICATQKAFLLGPQTAHPAILNWDSGPPWTFDISVERGSKGWQLAGRLRRDGESMTLLEPRFLAEAGVLCVRDTMARFDAGNSYGWIATLRKEGSIRVPHDRGEELIREMMRTPNCPPVDWPAELKFEEIRATPQPRAVFKELPRVWGVLHPPMGIELTFDYDGEIVPNGDSRKGIYLEDQNRMIVRDFEVERQAMEVLLTAGAKIAQVAGERRWEVSRKRVPAVLRDLVRAGWLVKLDGKSFRSATSFKAEIKSGIDWFEVHGAINYEGGDVPFPQLLAALERGEEHIQLSDGSLGVLPDDFLAQYGALLRLGKKDGDHIRFSKSQTSLLDALLFERGEVSADEVFMRARAGLRRFEGIVTPAQPRDFQGELRHYQLEGLGWLEFLRSIGLGGCLADDMGVGKTPQVLALLDNRRSLRESIAPDAAGRPRASLVVVPRSLIYNWKQEAARFTPKLRVLDHSMPDRVTDTAVFDSHDLILTTYGLLRRDVVDFRDYKFDYAILDEAQAIKNSSSESAKAARLLKADNRLVMSGTPIENHLGELWSLFEFLNPGMLGAASVFHKGTASLKNPDAETRGVLSKALRPLILRRTKDQVIKELPPKLEQTIYCEMDRDQRKLYEEMREHYRMSLLGRISKQGMAKSKMHILEALLRLRQAACHPGLIDKTRSGEMSGKLENLLPQLEEVMEGGHKALVFSQFTSLLSIVRGHLDKQKVTYQYLDGKTKDRQAVVERFQNDSDCKLFLVSLKAGGVGLNLTAAEYVFLLDPWWNPAVESQAIDRAHRIGQTRSVFAYRLISKGTVEEKVLELQKSKRDLADAIIGEDNRLIGTLQREDLELLLS